MKHLPKRLKNQKLQMPANARVTYQTRRQAHSAVHVLRKIVGH
jgi:hypothetical protein